MGMDDLHPSTACRIMAKAGCSAARFNFRSGIGRGAGSISDVKAVAAWFTESSDDSPPKASKVLIFGYSYGSIVGAAAAKEISSCIGFAVIGPPLAYLWALFLFNGGSLIAKAQETAELPKLLVVGTADGFCPLASFRSFVEKLPGPKQAVEIESADHFSLYQHLERLLKDWIPKTYGTADLHDFGARGPRPVSNVDNGSQSGGSLSCT